MVNLILTGAAGKMGQAILNVLPSFKELHLVGAIDAAGHPQIGKSIFKNIKLTSDISKVIKDGDVVIDFTNAEASITNLKQAASAKRPVVIGVTGYNSDQRAEINSLSKLTPVIYSPNMSVGVNVMWKLIEEASSILGKDYKIDIVETHHINKKDAPSGTARKMIEIVAGVGRYDLRKDVFYYLEGAEISESDAEKMSKRPIKVKSIREGEIIGDHTIIFTSPYERLEITHRAFSREVFASGALKAAMWVLGKPAGLYEMKDVLGIK